MLIFERTQDLELVRSIMAHRRVYPWISDDSSPAAADFRPVDHPGIWYVLVLEQLHERQPHNVLGLFVFTPQGAACWEVHTCLLPIAWGRRAAAAAAGAAEWLFERTSCSRIVTTVPVFNRLALRFARAAGMTEFGRNPASYLKNGKLHDQVLLGLSREENDTCPQQ